METNLSDESDPSSGAKNLIQRYYKQIIQKPYELLSAYGIRRISEACGALIPETVKKAVEGFQGFDYIPTMLTHSGLPGAQVEIDPVTKTITCDKDGIERVFNTSLNDAIDAMQRLFGFRIKKKVDLKN